MYLPKHFEEHRPDELHRVIREFPLGMLVIHGSTGLDANHIPFELDHAEAQPVLRAHVARANDVWREAREGDAVHVHGKLRIRDDAAFVRGVVAKLTRTQELRAGEERPWKMTDSSKEFIDQMIAAVVGIEISVDRMIGKCKLGQNKDERDRTSAAEQLLVRGEQLTSAAMLATHKP